MVDLLEKSRIAVDEMFDYLGKLTLETVLLISASNVASEPHQGRKGGNIVRHGVQEGGVSKDQGSKAAFVRARGGWRKRGRNSGRTRR